MSSKKTATKIAHVHANTVKCPQLSEYTGPVAKAYSEGWNPEAHGGVRAVEVCSCRAVRRVNIRGQHRETGPWEADDYTASYQLQVQAARQLKGAAEALCDAIEDECVTTIERAAIAQSLADLDAAAKIGERPTRAAA